MGEISVDPKGVHKLFKSWNIHKAPRPDGSSARVLKECSSEIAHILTLICTMSRLLRALYQVIDDKRMWRQFSRKVKTMMQQIIARCRLHASVAQPLSI